MNRARPPRHDPPRALADQLLAAGMSGPAVEAKHALLEQVVSALSPSPGGFRGSVAFVPGRIEVLGKHTDYAGGRSLVTAVERGFCVAAKPREDRRVCVIDVTGKRQAAFDLHPHLAGVSGDWSAYAMTVGRRVARNFSGPLRGVDMAFASDLPPASGMSSSSALMIAVFKVLNDANGLLERPEATVAIASPEDLAGYLATIENGQTFRTLVGDRGVGTFGGSEDHTAICCCRAGHVHLYGFCPTRKERVLPMPAGHVFAIAYCGIMAEKTGAAMADYNRASRLVAALVDLWQSATQRVDESRWGAALSLADIVRSGDDAAVRLRAIVRQRPHSAFQSADLLRRLEHFLIESERIIPAAADALAADSEAILRFGQLSHESQHAAEHLLQNQVPQTSHLAHSAGRHGARAASAFGAGFGGSVWALVEAGTASAFLKDWGEEYRHAFPAESDRAVFFLSNAGPCATEQMIHCP